MGKMKALGGTVALFLAFILLFSGCSEEPESAGSDEGKEKAELYNIVSDKTNAPYKRSVEVVLTQRLNESELESVARGIKGMSGDKVDRTFIGYRLQSQSPDEAYWATTHYNPELKVSVSGLTADQAEEFQTFNPADNYQNPIGSWRVERGFNYISVAYRKDGAVFIDDVFPGEGASTTEYTATPTNDGGLRLEEPDNGFGEYFVITSEGKLQFWSENGNYYTANPRDPEAVDLTD